jgi:hypothetical protein
VAAQSYGQRGGRIPPLREGHVTCQRLVSMGCSRISDQTIPCFPRVPGRRQDILGEFGWKASSDASIPTVQAHKRSNRGAMFALPLDAMPLFSFDRVCLSCLGLAIFPLFTHQDSIRSPFSFEIVEGHLHLLLFVHGKEHTYLRKLV